MRALREGESKACEACQEPMIGALTINGKVAPVELRAHDNGNVWLGRGVARDGCGVGPVICATLAGDILDKAREVGIALHMNHFATCPERERFERSKS